jgi:signal transduction histidine kinase
VRSRGLSRYLPVERGDVLLVLAVIAAHAAGQLIVYQLNHEPSSGVSFFPGNGVTAAVLLLVAKRRWPMVIVATYLTELTAHFMLQERIITAFGLALSDTTGPIIGVLVIRHYLKGRLELDRRQDLLAFLGASVILAPVYDAITGPLFARLNGAHGSYLILTERWWIGDALGVLIVGSVILAWAVPSALAPESKRLRLEADLVLLATAVITWAAFWHWSTSVAYLALVPVGWASIRHGIRGATTASLVVASLAEWATVTQHGLFYAVSHHDTQDALLLLQLFLAVVAITGLVAAYHVAEVRRAGEALRVSELAEHAARAQAKDSLVNERARLARELHDSVSQALFSMVLHARAAQNRLSATPGVDGAVLHDVSALHELTRGALAEMRALIFEMRPEALAEEGLVAALTRQAAAIESRTGTTVTVTGPEGRLPLNAEAEEHLYRVTLEALHNSLKHAHVDAATVRVDQHAGVVEVCVNDQGVGFDTAAVGPGHMGLHTMQERAASIAAQLDVESAVGVGTTVRLTVPAQRAGTEAATTA